MNTAAHTPFERSEFPAPAEISDQALRNAHMAIASEAARLFALAIPDDANADKSPYAQFILPLTCFDGTVTEEVDTAIRNLASLPSDPNRDCVHQIHTILSAFATHTRSTPDGWTRAGWFNELTDISIDFAVSFQPVATEQSAVFRQELREKTCARLARIFKDLWS